MRRHQAPTLIGCKFLKSNAASGTSSPAYCALPVSTVQQRSEIMHRFFNFVKHFVFAFAGTSCSTRQVWRASGDAFETCVTVAKPPSRFAFTVCAAPLSRHSLVCFCSGEANNRSVPESVQALFEKRMKRAEGGAEHVSRRGVKNAYAARRQAPLRRRSSLRSAAESATCDRTASSCRPCRPPRRRVPRKSPRARPP